MMLAVTYLDRFKLTIGGQPDHKYFEDAWLFNKNTAEQIVQFWETLPTADLPDGVLTARKSKYYEIGMFVTALFDAGEVSIDAWESAEGSDMDDVYSTGNWPFDGMFEIERL